MIRKSKLRLVTGAWIRFLLVVLLLAVSLSYSLFQGGFVSWFIFFVILPFILYSVLLFFMPLRGFSVERKIEKEHIGHGQDLKMTLVLKRKSHFPLLYTVMEEVLPEVLFNEAAQSQTKKFFMVGIKNQIEWSYKIPEMPRGHHQLEGIELTIPDFFGWIKKTVFLPAKRTIVVYPKVTTMRDTSLNMTAVSGAGSSLSSIVRDTTMVSGIREYQPGDRMSWIHWKTFAKTQKLQTKEFEDQQSQDLCLVLDCAPSKLFEEQVELVASMLNTIVHRHLAITFLSAGVIRKAFTTIQTEEQLQEAMYHLAGVEDTFVESPERLYGHDYVLVNAATVWFVTSKLTSEWLSLLTAAQRPLHTCLCIVVGQQGEDISGEDKKMEKLARKRGVQVLNISPEQFAKTFTEVSRA